MKGSYYFFLVFFPARRISVEDVFPMTFLELLKSYSLIGMLLSVLCCAGLF